MSLRTSPAVEHVALPSGGTVTVWVGVPDDPYIDDKTQLTTVDVQLREGRSVLASVSTVLEPDDVSQGEALAREVGAALEAGEIGLHAHELEPFPSPLADRLRGAAERGTFGPARGRPAMSGGRKLGVLHGSALYLGALIAPASCSCPPSRPNGRVPPRSSRGPACSSSRPRSP